jgi:hypothetical protein
LLFVAINDEFSWSILFSTGISKFLFSSKF